MRSFAVSSPYREHATTTHASYVRLCIVDSVSRTQSVIPYAGSLKQLHHGLPKLDLCHRAVYVYSARTRSVYQALLFQTAQLFLKMLSRMIIQQCYNTTRSMFKFVCFHFSYFPYNSVDAISSCTRLHMEEHKSLFWGVFKS